MTRLFQWTIVAAGMFGLLLVGVMGADVLMDYFREDNQAIQRMSLAAGGAIFALWVLLLAFVGAAVTQIR